MRVGIAAISGALAAIVAINLISGDKGGLGSFLGFGRPASWLITLAFCLIILAIAGYAVRRRWSGILIDDRNKLSLSRLQLVLWTALLVSALMTAGLSNVALGDATPLQIAVPASVWALLGIGSFSFVAAPAILSQKSSGMAPPRLPQIEASLQKTDLLSGAVVARGSVVVKEKVEDARWLDLLRGDTDDADYVDVSKLQQLFFTVLLVVIYASALYNVMAGVTAIKEFPKVDEGFVSLLGLSHAAYLAYKAVPKPI